MGNKISTKVYNNSEVEVEDNSNKLETSLDFIASYYILTSDFKSLLKLYEKSYCDKLVLITTEIIEKYFSEIEIKNMMGRMDNDINLVFLNKDNINNIDVTDPDLRHILCSSIAKFYIKIAHLYASILTTVNPIYTYTDLNGEIVTASLLDKDKLPPDVDVDIYKMNICDNRISKLVRNAVFNNNQITINPDTCLKNDLEEEPGIKELIDLYYDDGFDTNTGTFTKMSAESEAQFKADLSRFYQIFTGETTMPSTITRFSDIKMKDCNNDVPISGNSDLFYQYAAILKEMIATTEKNKEGLIGLLDEIFVYVEDSKTNEQFVRINPLLTNTKLQLVIQQTREQIINMYLTCEEMYTSCIKIYEAIVEQKILETAQNQIKNLEKESENILFEYTDMSKQTITP
jgi:hypothetical protein